MAGLPKLLALAKSLDQYGAEAAPQDAKGRTRARVLKAGTALFQRQGYRRTSVDEIAREAGVAKGTVYVHFKNKAELLFHAIAEEKKSFVGAFLPLLRSELEPSERLRRYLELSFLSVLRAPLMARLMAGDRELLAFLEEASPELLGQVQRSTSVGLEALLEGVGHFKQLSAAARKERILTLQSALYAAGQLMDERVRPGRSAEHQARHLARLFVDGVGGR